MGFIKGKTYNMPGRVYISGVLTGAAEIDRLRNFYEAVARVCTELGLEPYVPHLVSDPLKNPEFTPREVYELDRGEVARASLVIAYVGLPSLGVGMEIEIAHQSGVPVVLLFETHRRVSRIARGNPAVVDEIQFNDFDEALKNLKVWLEKRHERI